MKKITFILLLLLTTVYANAQTVNIGGTSYGTIAEAVTAAADGDVILISGIHTESITIKKSITLRGTNPATDVIQAAAAAASDGTGARVISLSPPENTDVLNITIENLGIKNGNDPENGGGINADKIIGLLTLKNLIIEDNHSVKNGGAILAAGSNVDIIACAIKNNSSALDGGAILAAPNNGVTVDNVINIKQSLINNNSGRNGGAMYINGNQGFGNDHKIAVNVENTTIANNASFSPSGGVGAGAIWAKVAAWTGDGTTGNITLQLTHATIYNNTHASAGKNGLIFTGPAGIETNFSAYNSIIVSADDIAQKVLNFANTNTTNVVNCILGGLNAAPLAIVDDATKNNQKGRTATQSGLTGSLTDEGGNTLVIAITDGSAADDFCSAATGITLPTLDQIGAAREGNPDAGAYEFGGTLSINDTQLNAEIRMYPNPAKNSVQIYGIDNVNAIKVYSILGKLEKIVNKSNILDVSDLASGVYIVQILKDSNSVSKRLIIK